MATPLEEADLIDELGDAYRRYRERVPAFLPLPRLGRSHIRKEAVAHEGRPGNRDRDRHADLALSGRGGMPRP